MVNILGFVGQMAKTKILWRYIVIDFTFFPKFFNEIQIELLSSKFYNSSPLKRIICFLFWWGMGVTFHLIGIQS